MEGFGSNLLSAIFGSFLTLLIVVIVQELTGHNICYDVVSIFID